MIEKQQLFELSSKQILLFKLFLFYVHYEYYMIKQNIELFPTLIQKYESFLNKKQCENIVDYCKYNKKIKDNFKYHSLLINSVSSYDDFINNNILYDIKDNVYECCDIIERLILCITDFKNESGIRDIQERIDYSWVNIQYKNGLLKEHNHADLDHGSRISGALYLKTDDLSSNIYFHNPNPLKGIILPGPKYNRFNSWWYEIKPKVGDLILFPSWLTHGSNYELNKSEERITLSFNIS